MEGFLGDEELEGTQQRLLFEVSPELGFIHYGIGVSRLQRLYPEKCGSD